MVELGVSLVWAVAGLWLLRGGVVLQWVGRLPGWSTSIGEASVGGIVAAAIAYKPGADVLGMTATSKEEREGSVSIGVGGSGCLMGSGGGISLHGSSG